MAGNRATQQKKGRYCNAVSSSRCVPQLERRPAPLSAASFTFLPGLGFDEAHVKRDALFARQLVRSSDHEDHIGRRPLRSEAALLLWQDILPFAVIAQAIGDYLENFASTCHERDATIVATLRAVLRVVQYYDRGIFPRLRLHPRTIWRSQWRGTAPVYGGYHSDPTCRISLSSSAGGSSGPTAFRLDMLLMFSSTTKIEGESSRGMHGGHMLSSSTLFRSNAGDLVLRKVLDHGTHRSRVSPMS